MGTWPTGPGDFVGRQAERESLRHSLTTASQGRVVAVLVQGEAGVGKTRLVAGAVTESAATWQVLWASCLRLGAVAVPGLPLLNALDTWSTTAEPAARSAVHDAAPDLATLLTAVAAGRPGAPPAAFGAVRGALHALSAAGPTLLVVDDVQWADPTTRDILAYLLADPRRHPLCIWLTWRDEGRDRGDAGSAWRSDLRRLPTVTALRLSRFDEADTCEQLRSRLGRDPDPELVRRLFARTDGNAYFNELLADEVDQTTGTLPAVLPDALRGALLAGWHRLSESGRRILQLLAVAGHPTPTTTLARVAQELGESGAVGDAIRESVSSGAVRIVGDDVWFRHPLIAEVLLDDLLPDEAAARHRAFAVAAGTDLPLADLARHQAFGGLYDEAFASCLSGAAEAAAARALRLQADLLVQAARLHARLSPEARATQAPEAALCGEAAYAARRVGETVTALELAERARAVLDTEPDPDRRAGLLTLWAELVSVESGGSVRDALEEAISVSGPDTAERARALAWLADVDRREGDARTALRHADAAVSVARRCAEPTALAFALGLRVDIGADPVADAEEAWQIALRSGEADAIGLAAISRVNAMELQGRGAEGAEHLLQAYRRTEDVGAVGLAHLLGAYAGRQLTEVGRTTEADEVLRRVLASGPRGLSGNQARQAAAVLALRTGRIDEAERHVGWLHEITGGLMDAPGLYAPATMAEHLLVHRRPDEALAVLARTMRVHAAGEQRFGDRLLAWAARAAADLAAHGRDAADPAVVTRAEEALNSLRIERAAAGEPFADDTPLCRAWQAVFIAESRRCSDTATAQDWELAAERCAAAAMPHEQARALLHQAALTLPAERAPAAALLRRAHSVASAMGAAPLVEEVTALAAAARLSLVEPTTPDDPSGSLTPREREVLGHLVAGRTYAEIAAELFISEKTVSVHVSNILRKTGTANRVEAAAWARRAQQLGPTSGAS